MKWSDLSLAKKLIIPIAVLAVLMIVLSFLQIRALQSITAHYGNINREYIPALGLVLNADRDLYQAQIGERTIALGTIEDLFADMHKENLDQVQERIDQLLTLNLSDDTKQLATDFLAAFNQWRPETEQLVDRSMKGFISVTAAAEISTNTLEKEFESIRAILNRLSENIGKESDQLTSRAEAAKAATMTTIFVLVMISLATAVLVAVFFPRLIIKPVNQLSDVLGQMAEGKGDLTIRMPDMGKDESGSMSRNFNRFISGMQQMIGNIQRVANGLTETSDGLKATADAAFYSKS